MSNAENYLRVDNFPPPEYLMDAASDACSKVRVLHGESAAYFTEETDSGTRWTFQGKLAMEAVCCFMTLLVTREADLDFKYIGGPGWYVVETEELAR